MKEMKQESQSPPQEEVTILPPDYTLKKAIGNISMTELLNDEVIVQAQQKVDGKKEEFLKWVDEDLEAIEQAYNGLLADRRTDSPHLERLHDTAMAIKSHAGTFGYDLASDISRSLYTFCENFSFSEQQCLVIRKHVDAIRLILQKRIAGKGGAIGNELIQEMNRLSEKFRGKP